MIVDARFLDRHRKKVNYLLKNVPKDDSGSLEIQSHWARYTCIVMYGYIEDSIREILKSYADDRCPRELMNYISSQLGGFQSANVDNILRLLASFDKGWESAMNEFIDEERRAAINSVVGNRHRIAHGLDVSVTVHQLSQWYPKISEVIDTLTVICKVT